MYSKLHPDLSHTNSLIRTPPERSKMHTEITKNQSHQHQMVVPLQEQAEAVTEEGGVKSLLMKRTAAAKLIGIGKTVFNEPG